MRLDFWNRHARWRLANSKKRKGTLVKVREFLDQVESDNFTSVGVYVPIQVDAKRAVLSAPSLASPYTRSFEIYWNGKSMDFVLTALKQDIENYKQSFKAMYPNCEFYNIGIMPEWTKQITKDVKIFDVEVRHGHFYAVFNESRAHTLITQLANAIQIAKYAWVQFVFMNYSFNESLSRMARRLNDHYMYVDREKDVMRVGVISGEEYTKHVRHKEKGYDFWSNYRSLIKHVTTKNQNMQLLMNIRGIVQTDKQLELPFSIIDSMPFENIRSNFEHLDSYEFAYEEFDEEKGIGNERIKIGKRKTDLKRIAIFERRLLPKPEKFIIKARNEYFNNYDRKPLPFLLVNNSELALFIHLPDATVKNIRTVRGVTIPYMQIEKEGLELGSFK